MANTLTHYYTIAFFLGLSKRAAVADNQLQRWTQLLDVQRSLAAAITAASDRLRQLDASPSTRRKALDTRHSLQVFMIAEVDFC